MISINYNNRLNSTFLKREFLVVVGLARPCQEDTYLDPMLQEEDGQLKGMKERFWLLIVVTRMTGWGD